MNQEEIKYIEGHGRCDVCGHLEILHYGRWHECGLCGCDGISKEDKKPLEPCKEHDWEEMPGLKFSVSNKDLVNPEPSKRCKRCGEIKASLIATDNLVLDDILIKIN